MASTAKEDKGQSSAAGNDGSWRQPPQAGPPEAAEDSRCPICLGPMRRPAFVIYCMHKFCFRCIWLWARTRDSCPVCRQPVEKMLYSVQGDRDYKECSIGLFAHLQRMARERGSQQMPAVMLRVMRAAREQHPVVGRRRPMVTETAQRQEAAPGPSNTPSQQAPEASHEMAPLREGERPAGSAAPLEPQNGTE